jgi:hypothetical protein
MTSQADLFAQLKLAESPIDRCNLALDLLSQTNSRQYLDECLRILSSESVILFLDDSHRSILREKCLLYYEDSKRDKAGMLREKLTRLLVQIGHPDDSDLYQLGVETYYVQPIDDVAQNLRAVALAGLASTNLSLACIYATKFLGEEHTSVFNCEPAMTAVQVLVQANNRLPLYQFLLHQGEFMAKTKRGELAGKAFESLGEDFPLQFYHPLIDTYQAIDMPTASIGIINMIIENRYEQLYDTLEDVILSTRDDDLRRYGLVMMSASRDEDLSDRLLRMARLAKYNDVPLFIEAVEVCNHPERDTTLVQLQKSL